MILKMWSRLSVLRLARNHISARNYSATADKLVDLTTSDSTGISTLTLQRPPVNSLNRDLLLQIAAAIDQAEENRSKGLILTSSSPSVFCAGLDILEIYQSTPERLSAFWTALQDAWLKLYSSSFPTVALINGHSPAGGCLFALGCEYRILTGQKFTIGLNETKLGIIAPKWFMHAMSNVIGLRQTEVALTTGRLFTANEALNVGLVDELVESKEVGLTRADEFFKQFKGIQAIPRKITKLSFREDLITWLVKNKEADKNIMVEFTSQPKVQQSLGLYIQSLKKK